MRSSVLLAGLALGALACGDPDTRDDRGYTKAPLENPGLLVGGEPSSPMAGLSRPNLPRASVELARERAEESAEETPEEQVALAPGVTREQFDEGRQLFTGAGACQACHGPNGGGSQLGPDLTDDQWLHIAGPDIEELAEVIRTGVPQPQEHPGPMPPMGGASLNDQQVQALAGYVASIAQS